MGLIRFLLAFSVVISHFLYFPKFGLIGADIAVEGFFVISGFYIAMIWNEQYSSTKSFLINRFLRLYPAYFFVAAINLFIIAINKSDLPNIFTLTPTLSTYLIFTNATMLFQDIAMFLGVTNGTLHFVKDFANSNPVVFRYLLIPQAWTLGIEFTFYLLTPILFIQRNKYVYLFLFISLLVRIYLLNSNMVEDPWSYRFFPSELALFMLGAISYNMYRKIHFNSNESLFNELGKYFLVLVIGYIFFFPNISANYEFKKGIFYLLIATGLPFIFKLTKNNSLDRFIGELSYPIYLIWALRINFLKYIERYSPFANEDYHHLMFYLVILAGAIFIHLFIERPFEKIRKKFRSRPTSNAA